ncbi:16S rRNA (guanine(966)-N(2))-methyltransferase RsmD [Thalassotalea aquiviva]|uniref:16S rRNA (guanine(966)-N(2))-methyltransferase RsmD n=1 Tax=Thalassotalea aquiviva TaxID=3242415 RepID=UPI00352A4E4E
MAKYSKAKTAQPTGQVRIIAGKHRGRKLPVLLSDGLRPTTDRVKETVFNWLTSDIVDARCLDCFAGSGSLGFEALSRGAKEVSFIELSTKVANQLKQNIALLKADNATVLNQDVNQYLLQAKQGFDLVFIDPPFRLGLVEKVVSLLEQQQLLNPDALIYIETESEKGELAVPAHWQLLKQKVAGQVTYRLYQGG